MQQRIAAAADDFGRPGHGRVRHQCGADAGRPVRVPSEASDGMPASSRGPRKSAGSRGATWPSDGIWSRGGATACAKAAGMRAAQRRYRAAILSPFGTARQAVTSHKSAEGGPGEPYGERDARV